MSVLTLIQCIYLLEIVERPVRKQQMLLIVLSMRRRLLWQSRGNAVTFVTIVYELNTDLYVFIDLFIPVFVVILNKTIHMTFGCICDKFAWWHVTMTTTAEAITEVSGD